VCVTLCLLLLSISLIINTAIDEIKARKEARAILNVNKRVITINAYLSSYYIFSLFSVSLSPLSNQEGHVVLAISSQQTGGGGDRST
jgi:hypothetical protein